MSIIIFYEKAEWSHITSSPEEEEHSLDEWTDFADYLIVIARDDPYTKYCEEHGIDPNRDILFFDQI